MKKKKKNSILHKISSHFFLRNMILAVCVVIVGVYLISLALNLFTRHAEKFEVPDLIGNTIAQSSSLVQEASLELVINDSLYIPGMEPGAIIDQSPEPKSFVKSGRKVFLVINSVSPRSEEIPYVTGYSLRLAKNILQSEGFTIDKLVYRSDIATNNVIGQQYKGKEIVKGSSLKAVLGEKITLVVGRANDAPLPSVPKLVGLTLREAQSRLWEMGFNIGSISYDNSVSNENRSSAKVYRQSSYPGSKLNYGSSVSLNLSLDDKVILSSSKEADIQERKAIQEAKEMEDKSATIEDIPMVDGNVSEAEFNALFEE